MNNSKTFKIIQEELEKHFNSKIAHIKELEKEHWRRIENQREKLKKIKSEKQALFNEYFPPNSSSLIYACIDGVIIIRHLVRGRNQIEVKHIQSTISKTFNNLIVPYDAKRDVNFSKVNFLIKLVPGGTVRFEKVGLDDFFFEFLSISSFLYSKNEDSPEWKETFLDIKLLFQFDSLRRKEESTPEPNKLRGSVISRLKEILASYRDTLNSAEREEEIQLFLKEHPIVLLPVHTKVFPKQKLGEDLITDFVFQETFDSGVQYTFVEIERVSMNIFKKDGDFTSDFNHANEQTLDWESWLEKNSDYLKRKLPYLERPKFLIVAGRSTEFSETNREKLRSWNRRQSNTTFLTYDDLAVQMEELIKSLENQMP